MISHHVHMSDISTVKPHTSFYRLSLLPYIIKGIFQFLCFCVWQNTAEAGCIEMPDSDN